MNAPRDTLASLRVELGKLEAENAKLLVDLATHTKAAIASAQRESAARRQAMHLRIALRDIAGGSLWGSHRARANQALKDEPRIDA